MGDELQVLKQTVARLERKVNELSAGDSITALGAQSPVDFQPVPITSPTPPAANQTRNGDLSHSVNTYLETVAAPATDKVRECGHWFSNDTPAAGQNLSLVDARSSSTNKTLKAPTHSTYDASYCDWGLPDGIARLTGTKSLDAPFPSNTVFPNRPLYTGAIVAFRNDTIVADSDCRIAAMLYNNDPAELDFMKSSEVYHLDGEIRGTPANTTERRYRVLAQTDRGYEFLSDELTVATAPADGSFVAGVDVYLTWPRIDGILRYRIYRFNVVAGTYDLLKEITSGSNTYGDNNFIYQADVGGYPVASDDRVKCYVATLTGALTALPVNGVALKWASLFLNVPVPATLDHSGSGFQWLRLALTKALDRRMVDAVSIAGNVRVESATGAFTALDTSRTATLYDADGNVVHGPGTITFVDATHVDFVSTVSTGNVGATLFIEEGGDQGLLIDMIHVGYISRSAYAPFPDDLNRTLPSTAAPNTSSQGGLGPGGDNGDPGDGGIGCVEVSTPTWLLFGNEYAALPFIEVPRGQLLKSGNQRPNVVLDVSILDTDNLHIVRCANGVELPCSPGHVLFRSVTDPGVPLYRLQEGDSVLTCLHGRDECSLIVEIIATGMRAKVGTFTLGPGNRFLAGRLNLRWWQRLWLYLSNQKANKQPSGIYCHNRKPNDGGLEVQ